MKPRIIELKDAIFILILGVLIMLVNAAFVQHAVESGMRESNYGKPCYFIKPENSFKTIPVYGNCSEYAKLIQKHENENQ